MKQSYIFVLDMCEITVDKLYSESEHEVDLHSYRVSPVSWLAEMWGEKRQTAGMLLICHAGNSNVQICGYNRKKKAKTFDQPYLRRSWSDGRGNQKRRHDGAVCVFIILTVQRYEEHFHNSCVSTTLEW